MAAAMTLCGLAFLPGCRGFNPSRILDDVSELILDSAAVGVVDLVFDDILSSLCEFRNNGQCDDGRPGALTELCPLGTDSEDCLGNDNQFCNGVEICNVLLICQTGTPPNCADTVACTDDSCDSSASGGTGSCVHTPNDANCDDGLFCNGIETCDALLGCQAGIAPNCDDALNCTDDSCDPTANDGTGSCVNAPSDADCTSAGTDPPPP